jgi:hypothetical protein
MVKKAQLPVIGGLRKIVQTGSSATVGTTIAELGSGTVTLAQLQALLAAITPASSGLIGDGTEATLVAGQGIGGGGPMLGAVKVYLTAPIPIGDGDLIEGEPGPPGKQGAAGIPGAPGFIIPGEDGQDGEMGPPGIGSRGLQGVAGANGVSGWTIPGEDGPEGEQGPPGLGSPGIQGAAGANGVNGINGWTIPGEDGADGEPGAPGTTGSRGPQGVPGIGIPGEEGPEGEPGVIIYGSQAAGSTSFANPTASVGLVAVNGSATTAMRSDAAPALSQAIAPTWTGAHIFSPSGAVVAATFNGGSGGNYVAQFNGVATAGASNGIYVKAGTNASDFPVVVQNQAGTQNYFNIGGDGHGQLGPSSNGLTWTAGGNYSISAPTSGTALTVTGVASANACVFFGSGSAGTNFGLVTQAGTNASDYSFKANNAGGSAMFTVAGSGAVTIAAPASGVALTVKGVSGADALDVFVGATQIFSVSSTAMFANTWGSQSGVQTITAGSGLQINGQTTVAALLAANSLQATAVAAAAGAGAVTYGGTTSGSASTTVGGVALPALAVGFIIINVAGTARKLPYFAT